ncbi:4Fe-4S binding protein [Coralliovum pocilloporae]|uniref:4Fe-4S binding protein n=1 Tax=Coralliovum pocilloporae TaxID=3066369 RepID=UPI003307493F
MPLVHKAWPIAWLRTLILCLFAAVFSAFGPADNAEADVLLTRYLDKVTPGELVPGADAFGSLHADLPVVPVLQGGERVAWAFLTSDFVETGGYSGKPIHVIVAVDDGAVVRGVNLVKHWEPIVLIGIPEKRIVALMERYKGLDLKAEAVAEGSAHELDIISGATVTIMVIDDSIVRGGLKVSRALGLGDLKPEDSASGPKQVINPDKSEVSDWMTLTGDGSVRRLSLDIGQINDAFARSGDVKAAKRPEPGPGTDTYIDLYGALANVPTIGRTLMGEAEYGNLVTDLKEGENALILAARGRYSYKGSGYVRGGLFDRIQLIQGDLSVRFRDRHQRRLGVIAADGAPEFTEIDIFRIPAESEFDPTKPWRLQLLAQRATGPVDKAFLTFDLGYSIPQHYLKTIAPPVQAQAAEEDNGRALLWKRIWQDRRSDVLILGLMLTVLTGLFFFQKLATIDETVFLWIRMTYLAVTLVWLGWMANAQLSIVNIFAIMGAFVNGFAWDTFLTDPLVFILWFSVAAALIFWGRGAFCGWLCPFGALQELTNRLAKICRVPQWTVPWALHERLWPVKYMIFLGLFGLSLYSIESAEHYAEIEPFKTAIILKFDRAWPYVLFAVGLLAIGLFVERFYCRYLCPLGAALAIPARIRMFDWLKRYRECGSPCQRCARECMVQAIHPEGDINPNECLNCLHCQVLYQHDQKCPVCIKTRVKRQKFRDRNQPISGDPSVA